MKHGGSVVMLYVVVMMMFVVKGVQSKIVVPVRSIHQATFDPRHAAVDHRDGIIRYNAPIRCIGGVQVCQLLKQVIRVDCTADWSNTLLPWTCRVFPSHLEIMGPFKVEYQSDPRGSDRVWMDSAILEIHGLIDTSSTSSFTLIIVSVVAGAAIMWVIMVCTSSPPNNNNHNYINNHYKDHNERRERAPGGPAFYSSSTYSSSRRSPKHETMDEHTMSNSRTTTASSICDMCGCGDWLCIDVCCRVCSDACCRGCTDVCCRVCSDASCRGCADCRGCAEMCGEMCGACCKAGFGGGGGGSVSFR